MRVLLIAPTCDGEDVGESWVAFQWAARLSQSHEVTLLTYHKRGRKPASEQLKGLRVVEWVEPPLLGRAERLNSMMAPGYIPFYIRARRWIRAALRRGEQFDIVHQPVPVAMRYPCPATGLGLPVVIGPVGGGLHSPPAFAVEEGTDPWFVRLRRFDQMRLQHDPMLKRTYTEAACVLGIAPYVAEKLAGLTLKRFMVMSETALVEAPAAIDRSNRIGPIRALFVGRLVRTKGAREAIRAMFLCSDLPLELDIVGNGPDREACEALVSEMGLGGRVRFHGSQPRDVVMRFYEKADIFVFPSYREPGGNVALEAMGHSLPLIVCDRGGPGAATDDSCAMKLRVTTPDALARDVASALRLLATDRKLRLSMGRAAYIHVQKTALWDQKIKLMSTLYSELIESENKIPALFRG